MAQQFQNLTVKKSCLNVLLPAIKTPDLIVISCLRVWFQHYNFSGETLWKSDGGRIWREEETNAGEERVRETDPGT